MVTFVVTSKSSLNMTRAPSMVCFICWRCNPPPTRFENKKREQELQAAKHLDLGSDDEEGSESDSETEDEDAEMLTPALDLQV